MATEPAPIDDAMPLCRFVRYCHAPVFRTRPLVSNIRSFDVWNLNRNGTENERGGCVLVDVLGSGLLRVPQIRSLRQTRT